MRVERQHNSEQILFMRARRQLFKNFLMPAMHAIEHTDGKPGIL
jgi:hypothetical protein